MNNKLELNPNMQYILCGDISASMQEIDPACAGLSRYKYMLEKFKLFIKEAEDFDPDGPTILMFGEYVHEYKNTTLEKVDKHIGNPQFEGMTNTHLVIEHAWGLHYAEKEDLGIVGKKHPGTTVLVFTDGQPTNQAALKRTIIRISNSLDREDEFNISFILVGTVSNQLREYLDELDDGLAAECHFDIVGTTNLEGLTFMKAVHNAVNE